MAERNRTVFSKMITVYLSKFLLQVILFSFLYELVSHSCFMYVNGSRVHTKFYCKFVLVVFKSCLSFLV